MASIDFDATKVPSIQNFDEVQNTPQAAYQHSQWGSTDSPPIAAPTVPQPTTFSAMRAARRWLIASPKKQPFYVDGTPRSGTLDSPEDVAKLASYDEAKAALSAKGTDWMLGFALGPDESGRNWQGIDLDEVEKNCLADPANAVAGYVELSPSGKGCHAIGYGRQFDTLGSNKTGIEAYAHGRYFTVTENTIRDGGLACLADYVEQVLAPRHSTKLTANNIAKNVHIDPKTVTELRSALFSMRADDHDLWIKNGMALHELGDRGRELWLTWSATSDKFDPKQVAKTWDSFKPKNTGYQAVFAEAQRQGWVNPTSNAAQHGKAKASTAQVQNGGPRELVGRELGKVQMRAIDWLWTGWIPKGYITLMAGESGAGKSTVLADITARVTTGNSWPGETQLRESGRVLWLGSEDSIEEMTIPRLTACGANVKNVIEIEGVTQDGKRNTFSMQDDLAAVGGWLAFARDEGRPFAMLVIDPVTSYLPGQKLRKVDLNDAGQLRTILEPWLKLAQEYNIAIVCVTHFAKDTSRAMLHRVLGSAAFAQTCRSLCAVIERPPTKDYEPEPHEKVFVQVKVNLPEHPDGSWIFRTVKVQVGVDQRNGKSITATRPNWDQLDSALTPNSLVGNSSRGPVSKYETTFALWVKSYFMLKAVPEGHGLPISQVKAAAISGNAASESWWDKRSSDYLEKANIGGVWQCRPKMLV